MAFFVAGFGSRNIGRSQRLLHLRFDAFGQLFNLLNFLEVVPGHNILT
jgi:hypothetical protein